MHSRVRVPSERIAPPDVLRLLREVEVSLDLYYAGRGRWFVLSYSDKPERAEVGKKMLRHARRYSHSTWDTFQRAALMADGFSLITELDEADLLAPSWVRDEVQRLLARTPEQMEHDAMVAADASEGGPRRRSAIAVRRDYQTHEAPKLYRRTFGGSVQFAVNGLRRAVGI